MVPSWKFGIIFTFLDFRCYSYFGLQYITFLTIRKLDCAAEFLLYNPLNCFSCNKTYWKFEIVLLVKSRWSSIMGMVKMNWFIRSKFFSFMCFYVILYLKICCCNLVEMYEYSICLINFLLISVKWCMTAVFVGCSESPVMLILFVISNKFYLNCRKNFL